MRLTDAISERRSIRAFKPDAVPQEDLRQIFALAQRAPSWGNTQACEIVVVAGRQLETIKRRMAERTDEPARPDIPGPRTFPEPQNGRRRALGLKLFEKLDIGREDHAKKKWWTARGLTAFGAPAVVYLCVDRAFYFQAEGLNAWPLFDCALVAQNIMLLAQEHGLGTIAEIQAVNYPEVVRQVVGLPDEKLLVLGIAIGYPDWDDPVNGLRSEREPLENIVKWYGFDH